MALPSGAAAVCERATEARGLARAAARLAEVSEVLYSDPRYAGSNHPPDWALLRPNVQLLSALSHVSAYQPWRGQRQRPYLEDLHTLVCAIRLAAPRWVEATVAGQRRRLEEIRHQLIDRLEPLREAAAAYQIAVSSPAGEVIVRASGEPADAQASNAGLLTRSSDTESLASLDARRRVADLAMANPDLQVILADPRRSALIEALALDADTGAAALERAFFDTHRALDAFATELRADPEHIWRYPPVTIGTLHTLGELQPGREQLGRLIVALGRAITASPYEPLWTAAALSIGMLSLFTGPAAGLALGLVDVLMSARSAVARYEAEKERDIASAAQAFSGGHPFTDRPASWGPVALDAAAVLLGAWQVGRLVQEARVGQMATAADVPLTPDAHRLTWGAEELRDGGRPARDLTRERPGSVDDATKDSRALADRSVDRDATIARNVEEIPATLDATTSSLLRARGIALTGAKELPESAAVGRARVLVGDRWLDGTLYWWREVFYFITESVEQVAVRIGRTLDDWAFDAGRGVTLSSMGAGTLDDLARAAYRFARCRFTRTATDSELRLITAIEVAGWERVVRYVRGRVRASAVKGKIAEELIPLTPEYAQALRNARRRAVAEGYTEDSVVFIRESRGITVSGVAETGPGELGDGMLVAFKVEKGEPVAVRIFAVFESKSIGNARGLVTRKGEAIGQVGWDFERLRELPTTVGERSFAPSQIVVSRSETEWYAMVPPEVPLEPLRAAFDASGWAQAIVFASPVRDEVLQSTAERVAQLVRAKP